MGEGMIRRVAFWLAAIAVALSMTGLLMSLSRALS